MKGVQLSVCVLKFASPQTGCAAFLRHLCVGAKRSKRVAIGAADAAPHSWLLCRAGGRLCALPLESVVETMRILPIEKIAQAPAFVLGLCLIRGTPTPVVEIGVLLGEPALVPGRMVTVTTANGPVAVLAESVLGVRSIFPDQLGDLPPLLRGAAGDVVEAIGTLDAELLLFLRAVRILPDKAPTDAAVEPSR